VWGQDSTTDYKQDSSICSERGHIRGDGCSTTLMYCPPYFIDYTDSTVMVYPACNSTTCTCIRCGAKFSSYGEEKRIVIWRKGEFKREDFWPFPNSSWRVLK